MDFRFDAYGRIPRDIFELVESELEMMVIDLLHEDRDRALAYLSSRRDGAIKRIKGLGSDYATTDDEDEDMEIIGTTIALLQASFARMARIIDEASRQE